MSDIPRPHPWYDREGQPITPTQWSKLREDSTYFLLAEDYLSDGSQVETVWSGIDMAHPPGMGLAPLLIFETMIWKNPAAKASQLFPDAVIRYTTEAEAKAKHSEVIALMLMRNSN